jgi:hypothetical protein
MCADKNKLYNILLSIKAVNHEGLPSQSPLAPASALNHNKTGELGTSSFSFFLLPSSVGVFPLSMNLFCLLFLSVFCLSSEESGTNTHT